MRGGGRYLGLGLDGYWEDELSYYDDIFRSFA